MIALSSCKQQRKIVIQNNFCESYEVLKISEDIAKYIDQIKNKIREEKITTIEEKFAYLMLNHSAINHAKYYSICIDEDAIKKFKDKK